MAGKSYNRDDSMEKTAAVQSIVMQSLLYWQQEKLKTLQYGAIKCRSILCNPKFDFSQHLPRWQRLLRKRLGQVQIVLDDIDIASK